jgi:hypothetical protein
MRDGIDAIVETMREAVAAESLCTLWAARNRAFIGDSELGGMTAIVRLRRWTRGHPAIAARITLSSVLAQLGSNAPAAALDFVPLVILCFRD